MSFKLQKINNEIVKPIPVKDIPIEDRQGYDLFPILYSNIFICAKKKSGKTCVIFKILKGCCNKLTKVIIFSSTENKDQNMLEIKKWLEKKNIEYESYTSIDSILEGMIQEIEETIPEEKEKEKKPKEKKPKVLVFDDDEDELTIKVKKYKPKKIAPEIIFVFDDISSDLKSPIIAKLMKQHRHYLCKTLISSQYPLDLDPQSRKQIDYWLLFAGHSDNKLEEIYKNANVNIDFELFKKLYKDATKEKYHFLYVDCNECEFRKDFNYKYELSNAEE